MSGELPSFKERKTCQERIWQDGRSLLNEGLISLMFERVI